MEVRSNKLGDIRKFYTSLLMEVYDKSEAEKLLLILLEAYSGYSRANIIAFPDKTVSESELLKIHFGVKDLCNQKPVQYILGETEFYGMKFKVNPGVLIPRPETEELVDLIIQENNSETGLRVLDIGTGSGCIAVTLAKNLPGSKVIAIDISREALDLARENAILNNAGVEYIQMDILSSNEKAFHKPFDLIVSNPPYVRESERKEMKSNVLDYEPKRALFVPDEDPLLFYRAISGFIRLHLNKKGRVYCEINQYLGEEITRLFESDGLINTVIEKDMYKNDRFLIATK